MRKRNSFYEVVTLKDCNIVDNDFLKIINTTLEFFTENNIPFYHKKRHDGQLRHLVVRKAAFTGEILINLITTSDYTFNPEDYAKAILDTELSGKIAGILHTINDSLADVVQSDEQKYYTEMTISTKIFSDSNSKFRHFRFSRQIQRVLKNYIRLSGNMPEIHRERLYSTYIAEQAQ